MYKLLHKPEFIPKYFSNKSTKTTFGCQFLTISLNGSFFMLRCSKSSLEEKNDQRENGETRNEDSANSFCYQHGQTPYYQIRIRLQLVIQNLFCELLNVKLFKRQTPTRPEVLCKTGVLKSFAKFTEKHLCWSIFFFWRLFKKVPPALVFFVKFANFFRTSILQTP